MKIGALIISTDEPQLERCLEAVRNQTVPFSSVTHINNVIPENIAFNQGLRSVPDELVMKVDGDFVLYNNAVEIASAHVKEDDPDVYVYNFRLYDTFLQGYIRGCGVMRRSVCLKVRYRNMLRDDAFMGFRLARLGFRKNNCGPAIGTHFDSPDEFQVFRRFYCSGVKFGNRYTYNRLIRLYDETGDPLYDLGRRSMEFGTEKRLYQGSHNIEFDRKMFEEFKCESQS